MILSALAFVTAAVPAVVSGLDDASFPRIAMLWSPFDGPGETWEKAGRYALTLVGPEATGLQWEDATHSDLAEKFTPQSIRAAKTRLTEFQADHPSTQVLVETYFYEANTGAYPDDSPWWFRDKDGKKVQFWEGCYNMATDNPQYVAHVARRILAINNGTGGRNGVYLDNLRFDQKSKNGWNRLLGLLRETRPNMFIMANAGWDSDDLAWIAPHINGIMYEDSVHHTVDGNEEKFYGRVAKHDSLMRKPTRSVVEIFGKREDKEMPWRELARTLVYTDAAYLYSDSTYGHRHTWRPEWNPWLGKAIDKHRTPNGSAQMRRFANGLVVWNPTGKDFVTVLDSKHINVRTGVTLTKLTLGAGECALLKKAR